MLRLALVFLIVALVAGLFGFYPIAEVAMDFSRILFFLFLLLFIVFLVLGAVRRPVDTF